VAEALTRGVAASMPILLRYVAFQIKILRTDCSLIVFLCQKEYICINAKTTRELRCL